MYISDTSSVCNPPPHTPATADTTRTNPSSHDELHTAVPTPPGFMTIQQHLEMVTGLQSEFIQMQRLLVAEQAGRIRLMENFKETSEEVEALGRTIDEKAARMAKMEAKLADKNSEIERLRKAVLDIEAACEMRIREAITGAEAIHALAVTELEVRVMSLEASLVDKDAEAERSNARWEVEINELLVDKDAETERTNARWEVEIDGLRKEVAVKEVEIVQLREEIAVKEEEAVVQRRALLVLEQNVWTDELDKAVEERALEEQGTIAATEKLEMLYRQKVAEAEDLSEAVKKHAAEAQRLQEELEVTAAHAAEARSLREELVVMDEYVRTVTEKLEDAAAERAAEHAEDVRQLQLAIAEAEQHARAVADLKVHNAQLEEHNETLEASLRRCADEADLKTNFGLTTTAQSSIFDLRAAMARFGTAWDD
ncbi:hypothetical protein BC938DRAFT_471793 [Jimgerdemannia flammicorona]|uniref:Uncharacterized protein n=1 Tax=Jimgerdemannia flammicorona TaxID=994334 RepID=A0A433Q7C2_9FUNG|nr:hypothetical protein BC938DRAFT_471793 [Jimgerdemannia flammicorona]